MHLTIKNYMEQTQLLILEENEEMGITQTWKNGRRIRGFMMNELV